MSGIRTSEKLKLELWSVNLKPTAESFKRVVVMGTNRLHDCGRGEL